MYVFASEKYCAELGRSPCTFKKFITQKFFKQLNSSNSCKLLFKLLFCELCLQFNHSFTTRGSKYLKWHEVLSVSFDYFHFKTHVIIPIWVSAHRFLLLTIILLSFISVQLN